MAQQTAINWLREKLQETYDKERKLPLAYTFSLLNKAEQMEKEQIIKAIEIVTKKNITKANNIIIAFTNIKGELFMYDEKQAEQYYNETYNK